MMSSYINGRKFMTHSFCHANMPLPRKATKQNVAQDHNLSEGSESSRGGAGMSLCQWRWRKDACNSGLFNLSCLLTGQCV